MLRPVRMEQVSIIVAKDQLPNLLAFAGKNRLFHQIEVVDESLPEGARRFEATDLLARSSNIRNRAISLVTSLNLDDVSPEEIAPPSDKMEDFARFLDEETVKIEKTVRQLEDEEEKLQNSRESTVELARFLTGLEAVGVSLEGIAEGGFLAALAGEIHHEAIRVIENELAKVTYGNTIFAITKTSDETDSFVALFPAAFEADAKQVLASAGAKLSPSLIDLPTDPAKAKASVDQRLADLKSNDENLRLRRQSLIDEFGSRIKALAILSAVLEARAKALYSASATESTILLRGWIPKDNIQTLITGATQATDGLVSVQREKEAPPREHVKEKHDELEHPHEGQPGPEPPTSIEVPGWTKSLQSVIDNFGLPSYGETNPLPFMLFSFPVIFGLMFGDYGEGILFLIFGLFLLRLKRKKAKVFEIGQMFVNAAELIIMLAVSMIVFGLIFGDFFGLESKAVFGFPALFNPTEGAFDKLPNIRNLLLYMEFVLFFGVAHYISGLVLSAYNRTRAGHFREAFFGPITWIWFYVVFIYLAIIVVLSGYKFSVLLGQPIAIILFVVPLGLMGYWEGGLHAFEVFISVGSNTLSYLRIWALNLADFAIKFAFIAILGIGGLIIGNILVMILEGLIVFVQTLRLHWVEWFSKFYEGTGLPFAPYQEPTGWIVKK